MPFDWQQVIETTNRQRLMFAASASSHTAANINVKAGSVKVKSQDGTKEKMTATNSMNTNWKRTKRKKTRGNISNSNTTNSSGKDEDCLRLISPLCPLSRSRIRTRRNNSIESSKMLTTTIIVLTALATCYGLALSASTSSRSSSDLIIVEPPSEEVAGKHHPSNVATAMAGRRQGGAPTMQLEPIDAKTPSPEQQQQQQQQAVKHRTGIKNITAQNGQNVLLHCVVEPSGDQADLAVSWFRGTGELQLLTYERQTIIEDDRFAVRQGLLKDNDWALQIKNLDRSTDSGLYQCQTNSDPPQSQYYQLNVLEPQVNILGAPDMAVKLGAQLSLSCVISQTSTEQPQFVFWFRDGKTINYELGDRGKIVIQKSTQRQDSFSSNLQIFHSKLSDSGNYTCMPSGARPVSIQVHVLEGLDNKRLIMFQNDEHISLSSAASSFQQTNSAAQATAANALARNFKTTEGRLYALVIAYSILTNWYHLLAQVQTGFTLMLLAIIGYLIGLVTDKHEQQRLRRLSQEDDGDDGEPRKGVVTTLRSSKLCSPSSIGKRSQNSSSAGSSTCSNSNLNLSSKGAAAAADYANDGQDDDVESSSTGNTSDPLLERANSALNLLKSLQRIDGSCESVFECLPARVAAKTQQLQPHKGGAKLNNQVNRQQQHHQNKCRDGASRQNKEKPLESPSSSSSSSSASTGYNSADNSTHLLATNRQQSPSSCCAGSKRAAARNRTHTEDDLYGDHEQQHSVPMIELVSQPTALSLVMDELSSGRSSRITCSPLPHDPLLGGRQPAVAGRQPAVVLPTKRKVTKECSLSPSASSSSSSSSSSTNGGNDDDPQEEPHYSLPATTATGSNCNIPTLKARGGV